MNVESLMAEPWNWIGPNEVRDPEGAYFEKRVLELPDFFVAGRTREEVEGEALEALKAFLQSFLDRNELPPRPGQWVIVAHGQVADPAPEPEKSVNAGEPGVFPELEAATA